MRITTNPKLPAERFSIPEAVQIVDVWSEQPNTRLLAPSDDHSDLLRRMIVEGQAIGALVSDAALAALTIECGGVLHTIDRDFARFPDLR
ncbi:MAG: hypothetical protein JO159_04880 [Acidobacteria bacterium]|nr:hypothetical protein [Acidobacteriota bacterium]